MNKKGVIFTTMTIVMIILLTTSITTFTIYQKEDTIRERVESIDRFIFSLEQDISRQTYISGYRSILSLQGYITEKGEFIDDSAKRIEESLLNGTVKGTEIALMEGYTLPDWNNRIIELGDKLNLNVSYTLTNVEVYQESPWEIKIALEINITIEDKNDLASWKRSESITSEIPIEGFEDPLYLLKTNGIISNKIQKTPYKIFVEENDVSNLLNHTKSSFYVESSEAPSFLDRLEGKTSPSTQGIESLVNLEKISSQGGDVLDKSVVDHVYFSDENPQSSNIEGMPSWFKLDSSHLEKYQVEGLVS